MGSSLKEHDSFNYTKEKDNIESYLLRVIHRYFTIEKEYNKNQVESIIVEAIKRLKQFIVKDSGYVFSVNNKAGHVILSLEDDSYPPFHGELQFNKRTAFNKNFGDEADTVCEGNDPRLSDNRTPTDHTHVIESIPELITLLNNAQDDVTELNSGRHFHSNFDILRRIRYNGSRESIDLADLENVYNTVNELINQMEYLLREIAVIHNENIEWFDLIIAGIKKDIKDLQELKNIDINWLEDVYKYTAKKLEVLYEITLQKIQLLCTIEDYNKVVDAINKTKIKLDDGEFSIDSTVVSYDTGYTLNKYIDLSQSRPEQIQAISNTKVEHEVTVIDDNITQEYAQALADTPVTYKIISNGNFNIVREVTSSDIKQTTYDGMGFRSCIRTDGGNNYYPLYEATSSNGYTYGNILVSITSEQIDEDIVQVTYKLKNTSAATINDISLMLCSNIVIGNTNETIVSQYDFGIDNYDGFAVKSSTENNIKLLFNKVDFDQVFYGSWTSINNMYNAIATNDVYTHEEYTGNTGILFVKIIPTLDSNEEISISCLFSISLDDMMYIEKYYTEEYDTFDGQNMEYGFTAINRCRSIFHVTPSVEPNTKYYTKLFLKYDDNNNTITMPLPIIKVLETGRVITIQGYIVEDTNNIYIEINECGTLSCIIQDHTIYNNKIIGIVRSEESYKNMRSRFAHEDGQVLKVESYQEFHEACELIADNDTHEYTIQGSTIGHGSTMYLYDDGSEIEYFPRHSVSNISYTGGKHLYITKQIFVDYESFAGSTSKDSMFCFVQIDAKEIEDYFPNPRIYYQVFNV